MSLNLLHSQTIPVIVACAFICALQTGTANSEFSVPLNGANLQSADKNTG